MLRFDSKDLSWNSDVRSQLLGQGLGRLPHAMLLVGPPGVGKASFAEQLAALLLCESVTAESKACGRCEACRWLETGNHPDFRRIAPEGDDEAAEGVAEKAKKRGASMIKIDQIRELEGFVFIGSHREGNRVVIIEDADAMNAPAANSLLKILEEPPSSVYFLLISSKSKSLLPTIRSRCRAILFEPPEQSVAESWLIAAGLEKQAARYLDLAGGAPIRVAQWKEQGHLDAIDALVDSLISPMADPVSLAARWDGLLKGDGMFRMEHLVEGIQRWLFDLTQERMTGEVRYHTGWPRPKGVQSLDPRALVGGWREIAQFRRSARHPLHQLLFLENLAAHLLRAMRPVT